MTAQYWSVLLGMACAMVLAFGVCTAEEGELLPGSASILGDFSLWDEKVPFPRAEELAYPEKAEYQFLRDNAVVWHGDTLLRDGITARKGRSRNLRAFAAGGLAMGGGRGRIRMRSNTAALSVSFIHPKSGTAS